MFKHCNQKEYGEKFSLYQNIFTINLWLEKQKSPEKQKKQALLLK